MTTGAQRATARGAAHVAFTEERLKAAPRPKQTRQTRRRAALVMRKRIGLRDAR